MNRRREVLTVLGSAPWVATPTVVADPRTIGALVPFTEGPPDSGLRQWLRKMGDVEAETLKIVARSSNGQNDLLPKAAAELLALRPNVILTWGDAGARAAQAATSSIPIVVMTEDLVGAGHVEKMSRPAGNMTGALRMAASGCRIRGVVLPQRVAMQRSP